MPRTTNDYPCFLGVKLPERLDQAVRREAELSSRSVSEYVRDTLEKAAEREGEKDLKHSFK